jgi:hypothetical protein
MSGATVGHVEAFIFPESLSLSNSRATAVIVLVKIDITAASGKLVVLSEAIVVVIASAAPHALEAIAIPSLTTNRGKVVSVSQVARRSSIHDCSCWG